MPALKCPNCISTEAHLVVVKRQGIEIDFCPACRGVWLERGELDKVIERAAHESATTAAGGRGDERTRHAATPHDPDEGVMDDPHPRRRRRDGVLGELFDF
jgi:Zn-finger nucleic acid-binding protein